MSEAAALKTATTVPTHPAYEGKHNLIREKVDSLECVRDALTDLLDRITHEPRPEKNIGAEEVQGGDWTLMQTLHTTPPAIDNFREEALSLISRITDSLFN